MDHLLKFISTFATSAELRSLSTSKLKDRMIECGLSSEEMNAILSGNKDELARMMRTSGDIVCCVIAPEQPADTEDEQENTEPKETAVSAMKEFAMRATV